MGLNEDIGNRLRIIRRKKRKTQKQFIEKLDMLNSMSRSYYSMIEIGKRPASLSLLDMVSNTESVSFDYLCGIVDSRVNIHDPCYHQLLQHWSDANEQQKERILRYAVKIAKKQEV